MKLGIVSNEFFDRDIGRMGGFGWAAARVAAGFAARPELGVDVTFIGGRVRGVASARPFSTAHGAPLLADRWNSFGSRRRLRRERFDLLLAIDYRPTYRPVLDALPDVPVLVWVRDPRTPAEAARVQTLRVPGSAIAPAGIDPVDCSSLSSVMPAAAASGRTVRLATPAPALAALVRDTYGVDAPVALLPNIIDTPVGPLTKSARPRVVFLGRLDPIKRPWLFVELARRFPAAQFLMLGQSHFSAATGMPETLPANLTCLGHVDAAAKQEILTSAWVLVNTSIHEAMAVSFLEALAHEMPLVSCEDGAGLVPRYGVHTGRLDGDGLEGMDALANGLNRLLADRALRERLGRDGRAWVEATHTWPRFLDAFDARCEELAVARR